MGEVREIERDDDRENVRGIKNVKEVKRDKGATEGVEY